MKWHFEKCSLSLKKKTNCLSSALSLKKKKKTALHCDVKLNCMFSINTPEVIIMLSI